MDIEKVFLVERIKESSNSTSGNTSLDEFLSDRSRIVFSTSFRRLQQKAQVFSLEPSATVRTRMTHTIEVADIGQKITRKIMNRLVEEGKVDSSYVDQAVALVDNACLLHDIGNPPFGHFGEMAIQSWSKNYLSKFTYFSCLGKYELKLLKKLFSDFIKFDGNPQGFRLISKLHTGRDEYGFNLTLSTLHCALKYTSLPSESTTKEGKAGYFHTESNVVNKICKSISDEYSIARHPFTCIMEVADDISYRLSDISDGIEKRILTYDNFLNELINLPEFEEFASMIDVVPEKEKMIDFNFDIAIKWTHLIIKELVEYYCSHYDEFLSSKIIKFSSSEIKTLRLLDSISIISEKLLYRSIEAESVELTGHAVILGLLNHFEKLLELTTDDFSSLAKGIKIKGYPFEARLFNQLGKRYVKAYNFAINEITEKSKIKFNTIELWLRIHLIIDHVSGMTDDFALETYQMLEGINLMKV